MLSEGCRPWKISRGQGVGVGEWEVLQCRITVQFAKQACRIVVMPLQAHDGADSRSSQLIGADEEWEGD